MKIYLKNEFNKLIPENIRKCIEQAGYSAELSNIKIYLIGGIVRDLILNNAIKDIDITVEGDAIEFCKKLEQTGNFKVITTQENLKTAKVIYNSDIIIDFASTREEYYTSGGQLPIADNFGCSLKEDVKRRDFTINTMALNLTGIDKYALVDYFDGYNDIKKKQIRIIHDKSFMDDPSRIIRAIKFQMRFDFDIENKTNTLMQNYLDSVDNKIPLERIKNELKQYFSIKKDNIYNNFIDKKIYKLICNKPITHFNNDRLIEVKNYMDINNLYLVYMVLLLVNSDFDSKRLNLNTNEQKILNEVKTLLPNYPIDKNDNIKIYNSFVKTSELTPVIYYLITGDISVFKFWEKLKYVKVEISGKDLINLGYPPSCLFGKLFKEIIKLKLNGKIITKEDEIKFAINYLKGYSE